MGFSRDYKMEMQVPLLELSIKKVFFGEFWKWRECSAVVVTQNISLWISLSLFLCLSLLLYLSLTIYMKQPIIPSDQEYPPSHFVRD